MNALMIPARLLEILVCANGYKKAGKKLPINPQTKIDQYLSKDIFLKAWGIKGISMTKLMIILNAEI